MMYIRDRLHIVRHRNLLPYMSLLCCLPCSNILPRTPCTCRRLTCDLLYSLYMCCSSSNVRSNLPHCSFGMPCSNQNRYMCRCYMHYMCRYYIRSLPHRSYMYCFLSICLRNLPHRSCCNCLILLPHTCSHRTPYRLSSPLPHMCPLRTSYNCRLLTYSRLRTSYKCRSLSSRLHSLPSLLSSHTLPCRLPNNSCRLRTPYIRRSYIRSLCYNLYRCCSS